MTRHASRSDLLPGRFQKCEEKDRAEGSCHPPFLRASFSDNLRPRYSRRPRLSHDAPENGEDFGYNRGLVYWVPEPSKDLRRAEEDTWRK